MFSLLMVVL
uniref:Plasma-membrane H+ ATPase (pma1) protein n=1 Tax=Nicotiana plumbaginifolia TaxID=4092 RepID=V9GZF9_NICPL|nr:short ORF [Nicotiana plumbaginifolia]